MTKKDYILLANALKGSRPTKDGDGRAVWKVTVYRIADALARDNPEFKPDVFHKACNTNA